jgi:hypothetical protein
MTEPTNQLLSNFVDFLQSMNHNNQEEQAFVEELDEMKILNDNTSEGDISDSSTISEEEEIPSFFQKREAEEFEENGLIPKSIIRQSIFKQILKEKDYEQRNELLLYASFYKTDKDSFMVNLFKNVKTSFEKLYLKVCWKFYKLLEDSSEFEDVIVEKILESENYKLFAYHFTFHTKTDIKLSVSDYKILSDDKEKDELEYKNLIHSIFNDIYM